MENFIFYVLTLINKIDLFNLEICSNYLKLFDKMYKSKYDLYFYSLNGSIFWYII